MKIKAQDIRDYDASAVTYYASEQDAQRIAAVICWDKGDRRARLFRHTYPLGGSFYDTDYRSRYDYVITVSHRAIDANQAREVFKALDLDAPAYPPERWEIESQIARDLEACNWVRIYVDSYALIDDSALAEGLDLNDCACEVSDGCGYYVTSRAQECYEYRLSNKE